MLSDVFDLYVLCNSEHWRVGRLQLCLSLCCMLTCQCGIVLPAVHFLRVVGVAFCYICLFICFICYVLSLFNCTELPTWLLG